MTPRHKLGHTLVAGIAGGVAFVIGTSLTFALFAGSREGDTGVLFDPDTQHPKVIAAWKETEPLPRVVDQPVVILLGMVLFGIAYAFLYRSAGTSWPDGIKNRAFRLALFIWIGSVFSEFMGPFNVLHQPLYLSVVAWAFWTVPAMLEAFTIVAVLARGVWPVRPTDVERSRERAPSS